MTRITSMINHCSIISVTNVIVGLIVCIIPAVVIPIIRTVTTICTDIAVTHGLSFTVAAITIRLF